MLLFVVFWQSQHLSVKKTLTSKDLKNPLKMVSDQTQLRSKSLIRPMCAWNSLWLDLIKRKWPVIIISPDWSDLWSYHPQTEVTSYHTIVRSKEIPDPVNFGLETHRVCWTWFWSKVISVWHLNLGLLYFWWDDFLLCLQPGISFRAILSKLNSRIF